MYSYLFFNFPLTSTLQRDPSGLYMTNFLLDGDTKPVIILIHNTQVPADEITKALDGNLSIFSLYEIFKKYINVI